jgi:hypothetical protein
MDEGLSWEQKPSEVFKTSEGCFVGDFELYYVAGAA